jgi:hypothetical protein
MSVMSSELSEAGSLDMDPIPVEVHQPRPTPLILWRPRGGSNLCYRRERAKSACKAQSF